MDARLLVLGVGVFAVGTALAACGSEASDPDAGASSGASGSGSSGSSSFGGTGDGGDLDPDGSSGSSGGNCFAPVDMFVMFDRSGSMREPLDDDEGDCTIGQNVNSKWCKSINALSGYFNSQGATGQAAALQFFPLPNHTNGLCTTGDNYHLAAEPAAATLYQTLPSNAFDAILNSTAPGGGAGGSSGTPTEAAIRGVTRFTATNRRPGKVTIGILITDGDPNGCNQQLTALSNLLQAHFAATTVRTYVIGMQGATFDNVEAIAQGGNGPMHPDAVGGLTDACGNGAGPCRHWNVGNGDPAAFTAALAAIQESADGCKPGGGTVNPGPK